MRTSRSRSLPFVAVILAGLGASAILDVGCGGDDNGQLPPGTDAGPGVDSSPGKDATSGDTGGQTSNDASSSDDTGTENDTGTTDNDGGTPDGGTTDTGTTEDGATPDGGTPDTGTTEDSGTPDAGKPDTGTTEDSGVDAGKADSGTDASISDSGSADASDASTADSGPLGHSLLNPVQIDVSALFNANTVVTTGTGGTGYTAMDGTGDNGAFNDFATSSEILSLGGPLTKGVPDNALFVSNGTTLPTVQLAWTSANPKNTLLLPAASTTQTFSFNVPPDVYTHLQIYATGGSGAVTFNYTLGYSSGAGTPQTTTVPDWCSNPASPPQLPGGNNLDRVQAKNFDAGGGFNLNTGANCGIFAVDLLNTTDAGANGNLESVTFTISASGGSWLVFYGATAW